MSKKSRDTHRVLPTDGGWMVKRDGSNRASKVTRTKSEAVNIARKTSQNQGTELQVHKKDGKIDFSDSHGHDPCPPKDQK